MKKEFTKDDLRAGFVAETRSGFRGIIMPNERGFMLTTQDGHFIELNDYDHFLFIKGGHRDGMDIMKIWGLTSDPTASLLCSIMYRKLLWEREEPAVKMTISEIEKELGFKIEIIEEK